MPSANVETTLFGRSCLQVPVIDPALDELHDPVRHELGVDAELAVVAERGHQRVRDAADADLERGAVGDVADDVLGDPLVALVGRDGRDLTSGRSDSHQPTTWDSWIWLSPNVRGMFGLTSRKNGARPISAAT